MANESGHYIEKCKHGRVLSQCRCPGPKTEYTIECNPELCPPAAMANESDVIERARRLVEGTYIYSFPTGTDEIIEELCEELRASRARVAELEQDARRLAALEMFILNGGYVVKSRRGKIAAVPSAESGLRSFTRDSIRDLADAAMGEAKGE